MGEEIVPVVVVEMEVVVVVEQGTLVAGKEGRSARDGGLYRRGGDQHPVQRSKI